jgi:hypothetical protein
MHARDYRDIVAGGVLIVIGAAVAIHAAVSLGLGTLLRLGPVGFPAALGVILVGFGFVLLIPAFGRVGELPKVRFVPLLAVIASMVVFALMLRTVGMVPAVFVMTLIASRADGKLPLIKAAVLAAILALIAALIFPVGLGIRVPIFAWNW